MEINCEPAYYNDFNFISAKIVPNMTEAIN